MKKLLGITKISFTYSGKDKVEYFTEYDDCLSVKFRFECLYPGATNVKYETLTDSKRDEILEMGVDLFY